MTGLCVCDGPPDLQRVRYGIDEGSEIDEVSNGLRVWTVRLHAGASDGVKGHGENGAVEGQRSFHGHGLQAGELSCRVDGRDPDVCQTHRGGGRAARVG